MFSTEKTPGIGGGKLAVVALFAGIAPIALVGCPATLSWDLPAQGGSDATSADGSGGGDGNGSGSGSGADTADATDAADAVSEVNVSDAGSRCIIGGTTYAVGAANPANGCQSCQPSLSVSAWSAATDGLACGTGGICHSSTCVSGCEIGNVYYMTNAPNPNDPCQMCLPGMSTSAWSDIADGTSCGNAQVCAMGQCGTQCDVSGIVYPSGQANPSNACQTCQPGTSTTAWTNLADGASCGTGQICVSDTCTATCSIAGTVFLSGEANPTNACQSCQPAMSETAWTTVANGTACGGVGTCTSGVCGVTFTYTGAAQTFVVPTGVTQVQVVALGAQGGGFCSGGGGNGASVSATIAVTAGETLAINVGGAGATTTSTPACTGYCCATGAGGFNGGASGGTCPAYAGGGGGGASDVRQGGSALGSRVLVAAGGGGSGFNASTGGAGGTTTGVNASGPGAGAGATQSAGGSAGPANPGGSAGIQGILGVGGVGAPNPSLNAAGGGGGGGYYGGGGGGSGNTGGGGGGGSSYAVPSATSVMMQVGIQTGNGQVTITW